MADLPLQPLPRGVPTGSALELAVKAGALAALSDLLVPGTVLSARVVEPLGKDTYLFALRGRTLVAQSPVPLATDSIASLQVLGGGEQPRLRLLAAVPRDQVATTATADRLAALDLPDDEPTRVALAAFERAGAPLDRARLTAAASALATAPHAALPALAGAHASLARAGLPTTPLAVALAVRAAAGGQGGQATALARLPVATALPTALPAAPPTLPASPLASIVPGTTPASAPAPTTALAPMVAVTPAVAPTASTFATPPSSMPLNPGTLLLLAEVAAAASDPGDGPEAAERALRRAGLRPISEDAAPGRSHERARGPGDERAAPLVARLADLVIRLQALGHEGAEATRTALIEAGAQAVTPPEDLADYDLVLPLALLDRGAPTPARIAVTRRGGAGGLQATYLRVDADLSRLGPVSARISALDGGPITVHLVADPAAHAALTAVLPELEATLAARGLPIHLRLGSADDHHA